MLEHDKIKFLVIHCSDTGDDENLNTTHIHKMHLKFGWDGIGYLKLFKEMVILKMVDQNIGLVLMSWKK